MTKEGYCHECNKKFRCLDRYKVANEIYECPHCDYPNHISQLTPWMWRVVMKK